MTRNTFAALFLSAFVLVTFTGCETLQALNKLSNTIVTTADIIDGLKEALNMGVRNGSNALSQKDGFFKNPAVKILFPSEAQAILDKARVLPVLQPLVNGVEEKINRGAEEAAKSAIPIFADAIKKMSFDDARKILMGGGTSATDFFKRTTTQSLYTAFNPTIKSSLDKVGATVAWKELIDRYNQIPLINKINPRLDDHVTNKAIEGVFKMVADQEKDIRQNPVKRTTALLKKVFAEQDKK